MSTAAEILGFHRTPNVPARWAKQYQHLCAIRDRLAERDCSKPATTHVTLADLSEAASEHAETSLSFVAASATYKMLIDVLDALWRIEEGTYGFCERTGQAIEPERLRAIPWTRYSLQGQTDMENSKKHPPRTTPSGRSGTFRIQPNNKTQNRFPGLLERF